MMFAEVSGPWQSPCNLRGSMCSRVRPGMGRLFAPRGWRISLEDVQKISSVLLRHSTWGRVWRLLRRGPMFRFTENNSPVLAHTQTHMGAGGTDAVRVKMPERSRPYTHRKVRMSFDRSVRPCPWVGLSESPYTIEPFSLAAGRFLSAPPAPA